MSDSLFDSPDDSWKDENTSDSNAWRGDEHPESTQDSWRGDQHLNLNSESWRGDVHTIDCKSILKPEAPDIDMHVQSIRMLTHSLPAPTNSIQNVTGIILETFCESYPSCRRWFLDRCSMLANKTGKTRFKSIECALTSMLQSLDPERSLKELSRIAVAAGLDPGAHRYGDFPKHYNFGSAQPIGFTLIQGQEIAFGEQTLETLGGFRIGPQVCHDSLTLWRLESEVYPLCIEIKFGSEAQFIPAIRTLSQSAQIAVLGLFGIRHACHDLFSTNFNAEGRRVPLVIETSVN